MLYEGFGFAPNHLEEELYPENEVVKNRSWSKLNRRIMEVKNEDKTLMELCIDPKDKKNKRYKYLYDRGMLDEDVLQRDIEMNTMLHNFCMNPTHYNYTIIVLKKLMSM